MDEVSQERVDDAWDEGFAHGYSRGKAENDRLREENNDVILTFLLSKEKADDEIVRLRQVLRQITELSPFKSNTGNASIQYITQMLVKMTALAHEALKEKE